MPADTTTETLFDFLKNDLCLIHLFLTFNSHLLFLPHPPEYIEYSMHKIMQKMKEPKFYKYLS